LTFEKFSAIIILDLEVRTIIKLDYTLETPEERIAFVNKIINEYPEEINASYLEVLADYLILCMEKQERKQKKILTENRLTTVNKRETSFEGLVSQLENGEDGIYNLISENKNALLQPKIQITKKDLEEIPPLRQLRDAIELWEAKLKVTEGKDAYIIKKALIEMRKDQYLIKQAYRRTVVPTALTKSKTPGELREPVPGFDESGYVVPEGVSLCDPKVVSAILCNYSKLKQDSEGNFENDTWYLLYDFEEVCD
jgi:hypothetical protein